ncbi:hypothetical protein PBRA_000398, partial [Plasmodiophora brassicae]
LYVGRQTRASARRPDANGPMSDSSTASATVPPTGGDDHAEQDILDGLCRICLQDGSSRTLLRPCRCRGTQAGVHGECLHKWLITASRTTCEVCQFEYRLSYIPTPIHRLLLSGRLPRHWVRLLIHGIYLMFLARRLLDITRRWIRPMSSARRLLMTFLMAHTSVFITAEYVASFCLFIGEQLAEWSRSHSTVFIEDRPLDPARIQVVRLSS